MMGDGNKVYQSKGAKDNATFKQMEQMRKQAVMLDAIEDYRAEMDDAQDKGPGYQGVGDGCPCCLDEEWMILGLFYAMRYVTAY